MKHFFFLMLLVWLVMACDNDKKTNITTNNSNNNQNNTNNINNTNNTNNINNINNNNNNINNINNQISCTAPPREFWNYDLTVMPPRNVQIAATCQGEGEHIYVYVSDDAWADGTVDATMVQNIVYAWETATSTNPNQGIYSAVTSVFGEPPDVDSDPHIIIFVTKLGSYHGTTFDGYFRRENEAPGMFSNLTEMVYLDCEHHAPDSDYLLGVLAHEFTHMIAYGHDPSEEGWLEEIFSQGGMVLSGYWSDLSAGNAYLARTGTTPLMVADVRNFSYGAGLLFASWALDFFGPAFFHTLIANTNDGVDALNEVLASIQGNNYDTFDCLSDWATANWLNDPSVADGRYAYQTLGTAVASPSSNPVTLGTAVQTSLSLSAYRYFQFPADPAHEYIVSTPDANSLRMTAIFESTAQTRVQPLTFDAGTATLSTPNENGTWTLVVVRSAGVSGDLSFTVQQP